MAREPAERRKVVAVPAPELLNHERALARMAERGIDVLLAGGYVNFGYLTGFFTHFGRDFPGPLYNGLPLVRFAALPADPGTPPFFVTCPDEAEDAAFQGSWIGDRRFVGPASELPGPGVSPNTEAEPFEALAAALAARGLADAVIGVDMADIPARTADRLAAHLPLAELVDATQDFIHVRMVKTAAELTRLEGAVAGSERGHAAVPRHLAAGISERELAGHVRRAVAGSRTSPYILHLNAGPVGPTLLPPTDRLIVPDSVVSVDVGCIHRDYAGDKFHVYAFGDPPPRAFEVHGALDRVNAALLDALRPGLSGAELFRLGRSRMEGEGLEMAGAFVGHGIGIDIHETPYLAPVDPTPLEAGMVIVLEAGTRVAELGHFCSEITCLIEPDGVRLLTGIGHRISRVAAG